jgi:hypothetical protein
MSNNKTKERIYKHIYLLTDRSFFMLIINVRHKTSKSNAIFLNMVFFQMYLVTILDKDERQ